jgi:hypothetical protein
MFGKRNVAIRERVGLPLLFLGGAVCLVAVVFSIASGDNWRGVGLIGVFIVLLGLDYREESKSGTPPA